MYEYTRIYTYMFMIYICVIEHIYIYVYTHTHINNLRVSCVVQGENVDEKHEQV